MTRAQLISVLLSGTLVAGAVSACGSDPYELQEQGSVLAWVVGSAEAGGEASAEGTARWVPQHRCWVLEPTLDDPTVEPQSLWQAVVWPKGTTVESDTPPTLRVGKVTVTDGDLVQGSAGGTEQSPDDLDIPEACRPAGVIVINRLPA